MRAVPAPQTLLRPSRCPACGRPAREFASCPWCGERAPAARASRTDAALLLLAWAATALPSGGRLFGCLAAGVLLIFRCRVVPGAETADERPARAAASYLADVSDAFRKGGRNGRRNAGARLAREARERRTAGRLLDVRAGLATAVPALAAAVAALAAGRFPVSAAGLRPWAAAVPALLAAAVCLGRAPAEAPVPDGRGRARLLARALPGAVLFASVLPPVLFPTAAPASAAALGVLFARLDRPLPWLFFAAPALAATVPDSSAFALGTALGTAMVLGRRALRT